MHTVSSFGDAPGDVLAAPESGVILLSFSLSPVLLPELSPLCLPVFSRDVLHND